MPYECSQSITTLYVCAYVWNTIGISYKLVETNNLYFQALFNIALHVRLSDVEKGLAIVSRVYIMVHALKELMSLPVLVREFILANIVTQVS